MVSARLVQKIEDHWDQIAKRSVRRIRAAAELAHLQRMPESEVQQISQRTLHNLSHWLLAAPEKEISARYQEIGRQRCHDGMPLCEAVRGLQLMKETTVDYLQEHEIAHNNLDLLEEEEFERALDRFFDLLVFHLVRGYEEALRRQPATTLSRAGV